MAKKPLSIAIINPVIEQMCIGTVEKLVAIFPYNFKSLINEYPDFPTFLSVLEDFGELWCATGAEGQSRAARAVRD